MVAPQATVTLPGALVKAGAGAASTVIVLLPLIVLWHASINVHVSVKVPPVHTGALPVRTAVTCPLMAQSPVPPLVYDTVGTAGTAPQATVTLIGALLKAAIGAGSTVMVLLPLIVL